MGELAAFSSTLCWAIGTVLLRSQATRMDSVTLNVLRTFFGTLFLIVIALVTDRLAAFSQISLAHFVALLISLVLSFTIGDTWLFRSMELIGLPRAFSLSVTSPLYVLVIAWLFLGEQVTWLTMLGTVLTMAGTITIATARSDLQTVGKRERRLGVALAIGSAMCFAISTSVLKLGVQNVDVVVAGIIRLGLAMLLLASWRSWRMHAPPLRTYGVRVVGIVALAGMVGVGLGSLAYMLSVQQVGAAITASITTASPLFATPLSVLFLKEKLSRRTVLGISLCLGGVWLVLLR